jgi:hypothetical protein
VGLTADEREEMTEMAQMYREWFSQESPGALNFITDRRMAELLGVEHVSDRLMDIYVPTYNVDEVEFSQILADYMEENAHHYAELEAKFIMSGSFDTLLAVREMAEEGADFDDLVREFCIFYNDETGVEIIDPQELVWGYSLMGERGDSILNLQEGEISPVISMDAGMALLVQMYRRVDGNEEEIAEDVRGRFIMERRHEVFREMVQGWVDTADYSINRRVFNPA